MKNSKGLIFITVIVIAALMIFIIVAASNMILQDTHMVKRLRYSTQAQYLAEAGISDAMSTLATSGFSESNSGISRLNFLRTYFCPSILLIARGETMDELQADLTKPC